MRGPPPPGSPPPGSPPERGEGRRGARTPRPPASTRVFSSSRRHLGTHGREQAVRRGVVVERAEGGLHVLDVPGVGQRSGELLRRRRSPREVRRRRTEEAKNSQPYRASWPRCGRGAASRRAKGSAVEASSRGGCATTRCHRLSSAPPARSRGRGGSLGPRPRRGRGAKRGGGRRPRSPAASAQSLDRRTSGHRVVRPPRARPRARSTWLVEAVEAVRGPRQQDVEVAGRRRTGRARVHAAGGRRDGHRRPREQGRNSENADRRRRMPTRVWCRCGIARDSRSGAPRSCASGRCTRPMTGDERLRAGGHRGWRTGAGLARPRRSGTPSADRRGHRRARSSTPGSSLGRRAHRQPGGGGHGRPAS